MDMSKAALPARYGYASRADKMHPRFLAYRQYRSAMSRLLVDSDDFVDWLRSTDREAVLASEQNHPRFAEWQEWFSAGQRGREKKLPDGTPNTFPGNFRYWLRQIAA